MYSSDVFFSGVWRAVKLEILTSIHLRIRFLGLESLYLGQAGNPEKMMNTIWDMRQFDKNMRFLLNNLSYLIPQKMRVSSNFKATYSIHWCLTVTLTDQHFLILGFLLLRHSHIYFMKKKVWEGPDLATNTGSFICQLLVSLNFNGVSWFP